MTKKNSDTSPTQPGERLNLFTIFGIAWRGKRLLLFCTTLAMCYGFYVAFFVAAPRYRAATTLALQVNTQQFVDIESVVSGVSTETAAINTEIEVLRSRSVLKQVVTQLSLTEDPEFNVSLSDDIPVIDRLRTGIKDLLGVSTDDMVDDQFDAAENALNLTIGYLREAISVSVQRNSYVFVIRVTSGNKFKSATIANTLAEVYISNQIDVKFQATENATAWLSQRVSELEVEYQTEESKAKDMVSNMRYSTPEALEAVFRRAQGTRDLLQTIQESLNTLKERLLKVTELRERRDIAGMVAIFDDPVLRRLQSGVDVDKANSLRPFLDRYDLRTAELINEISRLDAQIGTLSSSLSKSDVEIQQYSAELLTLQQTEREVSAIKTLYETFLARLKETSVQRGIQRADTRVLSEATPGSPVAPNKPALLIIYALLGFFVGMAVLLGRQLLPQNIRSIEDLEGATGYNVLGEIPRMPIRRRNKLLSYLAEHPTSPAVEAVRNMRTTLLMSNTSQGQPPKVLMLTSAVPGEGKTTFSIMLAHNLAGLKKRVLLVECDIRRRTLSQYFEGASDEFQLDQFAGKKMSLADITTRDETIGIDVITMGKTEQNAADVFSSKSFEEFINEAREAYDFVILDTPPLLAVTDARIIGQHADASILIVAWDKTKRSQVAEAMRQLTSIKLTIGGVVLSQIDTKGMQRYGYGGHYGGYAGYDN